MEHQQEDMSSSIRGRRGVRRGVFIAASLVGASALGYSMIGATQPIAAAADDSAPYTCTIPDTKIKVAKDEEGFYKLEVPDVAMSGDGAGCKEGLVATEITIEDNRPTYDGSTSGKCMMEIEKIIDDGKNFKKGGGTVTADMKGGASDIMATAETTAASPQKETTAKLTGKFKGLKWEKCAAQGFENATITLTGGKITFTPK
ncbi:hypothetical protein F3087_42935 [Nocardia colli]|uniref:Uncharacterized protein n=1 Tax=Nocardia colli TaxID=2545717 RepID=A0A5N0DSV9_9NOCA|nr:hypothetical protein [Nocardia colli]KAA8879786.1 hypothetical protein F3087_42935 [Nocardia colli]